MNIKNFITALLISCFLVFCASNSSQASPNKYDPTLYMLSSTGDAQMLSSMIITSDGKVIVVDGGWTYDAEKLSSVIKRYGGTVDAWLITHPDPDHIGALYRIMQGGYNVTIRSIYCSLATDSWYKEKSPDTAEFVRLFRESLSQYNVINVRKNNLFHIGNTKIYVLNDRYDLNNAMNNSSIVYKVFIGDLSILYLGDLGYEGGEKLLAETPPYLLSSDIVQMSHHGQAGVGENVYKVIDPSIALWSAPQWLWTNNNGTGPFKTLEVRNWMQKIGCKNYVTADGDICLDLMNIK